MKLYAPNRIRAMSHGVHLCWVVSRNSDHFELGGHRATLDDEGVIAHDFQRIRESLEQSCPVVFNARRLAMHHAPGAHHLTSIRFADRLMSEAHAENRHFTSPAPDDGNGDTRLGWSLGAGRKNDRFGLQRLNVLDPQSVVASDVQFLP